MFILLLKTEANACTSLDFVGAFDSQDKAAQHISPEFGSLQEAGFGSYRMLGSRSGSKDAKAIQETKVWLGSSYLLAEY